MRTLSEDWCEEDSWSQLKRMFVQWLLNMARNSISGRMTKCASVTARQLQWPDNSSVIALALSGKSIVVARSYSYTGTYSGCHCKADFFKPMCTAHESTVLSDKLTMHMTRRPKYLRSTCSNYKQCSDTLVKTFGFSGVKLRIVDFSQAGFAQSELLNTLPNSTAEFSLTIFCISHSVAHSPIPSTEC